MKRLIAVVAMVSLVVLAFAGGSNEAATSKGGYKIGVVFKSVFEPRWELDIAAMKEKAAELGDTLLIQNAGHDAAKQVSLIENLINQGIDVLVLNPVDPVSLAPTLDKVRAGKIPVVAYDEPITGAMVDYVAIRNSREVGEGHAKGALAFAPPNKANPPKYALIKGDGKQANALLFESFWKAVLKPYVDRGEIKIVADQYHDGWSGEKALATAENVLTAQKDDVQAFITMNDSMAVGVAQALQARGLQGKVYLCGQDADKANLRLIVEGVQTLTYYTRITDLAHVAIEGAHALAAGQKPRVDGTEDFGRGAIPAGYCKVDQITKANMCNFLTKIVPPKWISVSDVYVTVPVPADCK